MCGFTGFIGETTNAAQVLGEMMDRIVHRGPDSGGQFVEHGAALGFRRLSIIDLEAGTQPMFNEDEQLVLIFNGEIYNFQELREELVGKGHHFKTATDSEVILHGFEEYGKEIVHRLRGMFAFVIYDRTTRKMFAARDPFGIKPFYYAGMDGTLLFGSEIKSFLPHPAFKKELNEQALLPYLTFQYPVSNETFFKGVFKLPAAHYMEYEKGRLTTTCYWTPEFNETEAPLTQLVEEIDEVVKESIHAHRISDVKVGSFLSSGVDSSYVASVLKPHQTFTVGFSDANFSEIDHAQILSNELGIENVSEVLDPAECFRELGKIQYMMDEPHSNPSIVPLYFLSRLASEQVTVVLSGEGADELFGGYDEYTASPALQKYRKLPSFIRKPLGRAALKLPDMRGRQLMIKGGLPVDEWFIGQAKIFEERDARALVRKPYGDGPSIATLVAPFYKKTKGQDPLNRMQLLDLQLWLADDILLKADKMSMSHSIELRVPFLDKKVMEVAAKVPVRYRVNPKATKYAFRLASRKALPEVSANRKKIGFPVPIRNWIKEDVYFNEILAMFKSDIAAQFFETEEMCRLLEEHRSGKVNNARKIWTMYMFLLWYDQYFVKETESAVQQPLAMNA